MMRNALARKAYWAVNKLTPLDITQVLLLDLTECREPKHDVSSFELGFVGADDVRRLTKSGPCELRPELSAMIERGEARCFAAVNKDRLAAYCWFAQDRVSPEHNAGGSKFAGIGLILPDQMAYLFNAFVLPEFRGQALNQWIFRKAGAELYREGARWMITTTEWTNAAFQRSAARGGFVKRGHAAEWVIGGQHFFRLPDLGIPGLRFVGGAAHS